MERKKYCVRTAGMSLYASRPLKEEVGVKGGPQSFRPLQTTYTRVCPLTERGEGRNFVLKEGVGQ
jgi:hypothetical protein